LTLLGTFATAAADPVGPLVVVGDGGARAVDRAGGRSDLAGAVHITVPIRRQNTAAGGRRAISSSISEGISITILEAMSAGVPVVATAVGGTPEIWDGDAASWRRDVDQLASAILLAVDRRRHLVAAAARDFIYHRSHGRRLRATYRRLLGWCMCGLCGIVAVDGPLDPRCALPSVR
jgi:glycosyltransferase involved in cell wall biosynthesis